MATSKQTRQTPANRFVLLASYPRSGNTLLRMIMRHCFDLHSASIYPNDLDGNKALEDYVGHIEQGPDIQTWIDNSRIPLVKTHELPENDWPAIYVVRDGRDVCISLWEFYKHELPIDGIITGRLKFGTWSNHLSAWSPWDRPNTLLLRYEDMVENLPQVLRKISLFLNIEIVGDKIPDRDVVARLTGGRVVRQKGGWRALLKDNEINLFNKINGQMAGMLGYSGYHEPLRPAV